MKELDPSASIVATIAYAEYPELFRFVTVGLLIDQSTGDNKLKARSTLSNMSRLSKYLFLFDTLCFFAISVLVDTEILGNLYSTVHRHSWWAIVGFHRCDIWGCVNDRGATLGDSSWADCPLESILAPALLPLWRSRISPAGEILLISKICESAPLWRLPRLDRYIVVIRATASIVLVSYSK